jgi:predicted  nucleic acid-binding Zn-ribbon protein
MGASLQTLFELQDIELQIVEIQAQLRRKEARLRTAEHKQKDSQNELARRRDEIKHTQARFDAMDLEVKSRSANIDKLREHLNTVKTNKDYHVILSQLNTEKADLTRVEKQAMEVMEEVDRLRAAATEYQAADQDRAARAQEARDELALTTEATRARLEGLQARRAQLAENLDQRVMALFQRLSERYDGETMARVERRNPRSDDFICGGCHMQLGTDVANAVRIRDDAVTCKSCGRILYVQEAT